MSKFGANLPAVLNPVGDMCVEVHIPNHPDYIKLFVRAIRMLEVNRMYERDETMEGAKIVTAQWRDRTITPLIEALATGTGICGVDGECLAYPPFANFISYFPQNPYTEPDLIPEGFEQPPFYVNGKDNAHDLPNYNKGDVIVDFGSINIEPSWDLAKTPRIELCIEGSGVVEIHLLNIVQGGACIISVDNPVDLGDILAGIIGDGIDSIDLNQDIVSLPPESAEEIIIEKEITTEGEHTVYIYFLPMVNDSLIPLSFGGGLREISLCGNLRPCGTPPEPPPPPLEGVTELKPQFQFTADCGLEYRLLNQDDEIVQDWTPVEGWLDNAALCFAVGGDMATKEDIRDALIEWSEELAKRVASGEIVPFSIDDEGNVTVGTGTDTDAGLPEDDPATVINETLAAKYGGMFALGTKIEEVLDKLDSLYGVDATPDNSEQDAQAAMSLLYPTDEAAMDVAVTAYYSWRATPNSQIAFNGGTDFFQSLYCNGYDLSSINRFMVNVRTFSISKARQIDRILAALAPEFWTTFIAQGQQAPSSDYQDAPCTLIAPQEFLLVPLNSARSFTACKVNHRVQMTFKGYVTDEDGDIQDAFWYRTAAGVLTRISPSFTGGSTTIGLPTDAEVPYNSAHVYQYTAELGGVTSNGVLIIAINENAGIGTPVYQTEKFTIQLKDFGLPYGS